MSFVPQFQAPAVPQYNPNEQVFAPTLDPSILAQATWDRTLDDGLTARGVNWLGTTDNVIGQLARSGWNNSAWGWNNPSQGPGRILQPDEANNLYGTDTLKFSQPIGENAAKWMNQLHNDDARFAQLQQLDPHNFASWGAQTLAGFAAGTIDPAQLGLMLATDGASRALGFGTSMLGRSFAQRQLIRVGQGAAIGAANAIPYSTADWALSNQEQRDYSSSDFLSSVVQNIGLGTLLHTGIGAFHDLNEPAENFRPAARTLNPGDYVELNANSGDMNRTLAMNDQVIYQELKNGNVPMSQADRIAFLDRNNGARIPDEDQAAVAAEKQNRFQTFQASDEAQAARDRAILETTATDGKAESDELMNAVTPDEQVDALEKQTQHLDQVNQDFEANAVSRYQAQAAAHTAAWRDVKVQVHATQADLEKALPSEAELTAKNPDRVVKGLFDPNSRSIHLVAGNIKSATDLADTMRHEGFHVGFGQLLGDDYRKVTSDLYDSITKTDGATLDRLAGTYGFDPVQDRSRLVEEYMAHLAEREPSSSLLGEFMAKLKLFLSKVFPAVAKWSQKDIQGLITLSRGKLTEGLAREAKGEVRYALGDKPADHPAKVLGKNEEPLSGIVTRALSGELPRTADIHLGWTPAFLKKLGAGDVSMRVSAGVIEKAGPGKHSLPPDVITDALSSIDYAKLVIPNPSAEGKGDVLLFPGTFYKKSPIALAIKFNEGPEKRIIVNRILTVHARDRFADFLDDPSKALYQTKETPGWLREFFRRQGLESLSKPGDLAPEGSRELPVRNWKGVMNQPEAEGQSGTEGESGQDTRHSLENEDPDRSLLPSFDTDLDALNEAVASAKTQDEKFAALQAKRQALINRMAASKLDEYVSRWANPYEGLHAYMMGSNKVLAGSRSGVAQLQMAGERRAFAGLFVSLIKKNGFREFSDNASARDIAREIWRIGRSDTEKANMPQGSHEKFREIAEAIDAVRNKFVGQANRAGAYINRLPGYLFRQSHDMIRVKDAGFDAWREFIEPKLDWRTIESQNRLEGDLTPMDRAAFLRGAYDGISTGVHLQEGTLLRPSGAAFGANEARKLSASRKLHFLSADDFMDYNDKFGTRNLKDAVVGGLSHLAQRTALLEAFGTNPERMFNQMLEKLRVSQRFNPEHQTGLVDRDSLTREFGTISGLDRIPGNVTRARIGSAVRTWENTTKLGGVLLSSLPDLATKEAEFRYQGIPGMQALEDITLGTFARIGDSEDMKLVAASLGAGMESELTDILSRVDPAQPVTSGVRNAQNWFFKMTGLAWWTDSQKRGFARTCSAWLGSNAENKWGELKPQTRRILTMFDLGEKHWDAMRGLASVEADGRKYVMPQHVSQISDETIKALKESDGFAGSLASYRDALETRWMNYYTDRADYAVITPGAFERSLIFQGMQPGTWRGEGLRMMMQYKSFSITMLTKALGRELYGRDNMAGKLGGISALVATTTALGYASLQLSALASGKTPYPPTWKTFQASMSKGGGLGFLTDYIFGQYEGQGDSLLADVAGPLAGDASKLNALRAKIMDGGKLSAGDIRTFRGLIPYNNLVGLKTVIDYQVMYRLQEALNPGYLDRMQQQLKSNSGQQFFVPPSAVVH